MVSRRDFLKLMAGGAAAVAWPGWLPRLAFAQDGTPGDVIVCVFLRGGADALNMIVPFGDE
ncbi:MAG: twin-arginine translocation signal domain-containing protein, partial [Chloroflexota bacterium]